MIQTEHLSKFIGNKMKNDDLSKLLASGVDD